MNVTAIYIRRLVNQYKSMNDLSDNSEQSRTDNDTLNYLHEWPWGKTLCSAKKIS